MVSVPWFAGLPPELIEVAHDWRYSDEYLGNLFRSHVGRSACSCYEAGRGLRSASVSGYGARMTQCKCGHAAIEHYDSHLFCTRAPDDCDCEKFEAAGPEVWISVGSSEAENSHERADA